jgi:hypothetical protein
MGNANFSDKDNSSDKDDSSDKDSRATSGERRLRGGDLGGSEKKRAVDHEDYEKQRNTDTELRLNEEEDSLYDDGLDVEEDDSPLAGTRGPSSGIKP